MGESFFSSPDQGIQKPVSNYIMSKFTKYVYTGILRSSEKRKNPQVITLHDV